MNLNRNGQAPIIVVIFLILIFAFALYFASSGSQQEALIKIHKFEVQPSDFKTSETGELLFKAENLVENDFTAVTAYFETHKNVEIYLGDNLLAMEGGNYTYAKTFNPKETSELVFRLKAALDIGDSRREYQVKAYIYVNGNFLTTQVATFSVQNR